MSFDGYRARTSELGLVVAFKCNFLPNAICVQARHGHCIWQTYDASPKPNHNFSPRGTAIYISSDKLKDECMWHLTFCCNIVVPWTGWKDIFYASKGRHGWFMHRHTSQGELLGSCILSMHPSLSSYQMSTCLVKLITDEEILLVHDQEYLKTFNSFASCDQSTLVRAFVFGNNLRVAPTIILHICRIDIIS